MNMQAFSEAEQALAQAEHAVRVLLQLKPAIVALKEIAVPLARAEADLEALKARVSEETQRYQNMQARVADLANERDRLAGDIEKYKKILEALRGA